MLIYSLLFIPIAITIILYYKYKHEVVWQEYLIMFGCTLVCIVVSKLFIDYVNILDNEYWSHWTTEVRYYEDWDERVHCRHPKYCTKYDHCKSRDSKGNCKGGTVKYQCGWKHPYDVDYHPEYWVLLYSDNNSMQITKQEYERIVKKFSVTPKFVDLHRTYHSNDGDMYSAIWPGSDNTLEAVITQHTYKNKVRRSSSTYAIKKPEKEIIEQYKLFDYPPIYDGYKQKVIQGFNDPVAEKKFQILNAKLGKKKQFKTYICIYKNMPRQAGLYQEDYWEGGNKNELNIVIGIDNDNNIKWSHVYSWTDDRTIVVETRSFIEKQKQLNLSELADYLYPAVESKWARKQFSDFDYLTVEPSTTVLVVSFIITLIVNVLTAAYVVNNNITE